MFKTKIPVQEKIDDGNGNIKTQKREIAVTVDTSIFAEERWEKYFPTNAKSETLFAYIERVHENRMLDKAHILSNLKALYCFLESDELSDFKSFCQLFDLADVKYLQTLCDKIKWIFGIVLGSSVSPPKN
ncbi:MAG: hypothetical protein HDT32_05035 [Clostridiales bacterium]|nr:hypothetical protein [Clostridiales bacterium]